MNNPKSTAVYRAGTWKVYPRLNPLAVVALRRFVAEGLESDLPPSAALVGVIAAAKMIIDYEEVATYQANRTRQGATP